MKNPYETLGVEPTATAAEIKAAWRKLCAEHHPDRGGDTATAAEINAAYDVLSSPQRRLEYDQGCHVETLDQQAASVLREMFDVVLEQERCRNPVDDVATMLAEVKAQMSERILTCKKRRKALERRLGRFKKDPGLIAMMVDEKLSAIDRTIITAERALEINTQAQAMLQAFAYETDPNPMDEARRRMQAQATGMGIFGRHGSTGLGGMWP